jgi:hypothetical protein
MHEPQVFQVHGQHKLKKGRERLYKKSTPGSLSDALNDRTSRQAPSLVDATPAQVQVNSTNQRRAWA